MKNRATKPIRRKMEGAANLLKKTFEYLEPHIAPGISTEALDILAHDFMVSHGARPAPLGYPNDNPAYPPFPKSICTSVNSVLAHGVPSSYVLRDGDLISIDMSLELDGHFADACRSYGVGSVAPGDLDFLHRAHRAYESIILDVMRSKACSNGHIGYLTQKWAKVWGLSVCNNLYGHGIGRNLHEEPWIPPKGEIDGGVPLEPGMYITIEPCFTELPTAVALAEDGWSIYSPSGVKSVQFEHTIAILKNSIKILV